ncbi:MAG: hypothetical protein K2Q17_18810, partial [Nitrospiraceae bacterium]|nr:hypothetical protein [Nitrospiraceae bacterium]
MKRVSISVCKRSARTESKAFVSPQEGLIYSPLLMCYENRSTELEALPILQQTLAEVPFEQYRKPTRREQFLNE